MAKIYDANGQKMNVNGICDEIINTITAEQKSILAEHIRTYKDTFKNSHMVIAHAILDSYRSLDSTSEQGMRIRKLLDNIMTKYQKSNPANTEDQSAYNNLISTILG